MKKLMIATMVVLGMTVALAATGRKKGVQAGAGNDDGPETTGRAAKIQVENIQLGQSTLAIAPNLNGLAQYFTKPRRWIVVGTKYTTWGTDTSKFLDQLTFNWHVVLETKTATESKGNREGLPPYSYFTTTVTYFNIPAGQHGASVCLAPSYLERYGEPRAVGLEISNEKGDVLYTNSWSNMKPIKEGSKFWEEKNFLDAMGGEEPAIVRRQGLVDRSKTIWALVNPNDYESTLQ